MIELVPDRFVTRNEFALSNSERALANSFSRRLQLDLDVVPKAIKTLHHLALGEIGKIAAHEAGNLRLRDAHLLASFLLGEAETPDRARDLDCEAGLDLQLVGVRETEVPKHISRAAFEFNCVRCLPRHFESPVPMLRLT